MKWLLLLLACVGLAFVPWSIVFARSKPYAGRVVIGALIAALIIFITFNFGPLKIL